MKTDRKYMDIYALPQTWEFCICKHLSSKKAELTNSRTISFCTLLQLYRRMDLNRCIHVCLLQLKAECICQPEGKE